MIDCRSIAIAAILPQRPPFLFVDQLLGYEEGAALTAYTVPSDGLMTEDGVFVAEGLMEHMAQTGAAFTGYRAKYVLHIPVRIGYLGSISHWQLHRLPRVGETVTTRLTLLQEVYGICLYEACSRIGEEIIATARIKTALGEQEMKA